MTYIRDLTVTEMTEACPQLAPCSPLTPHLISVMTAGYVMVCTSFFVGACLSYSTAGCHGTHFTNGLWVYNSYLVITLFTVILFSIVQSGHDMCKIVARSQDYFSCKNNWFSSKIWIMSFKTSSEMGARKPVRTFACCQVPLVVNVLG